MTATGELLAHPWAAVAAGLALLATAWLARASARSARIPVRARAFLTGNEREFLGRLERALPEARIHAQVAMGALLEPSFRGKGRQGAARAMAVRNRYDRKVCDFVVQDRSGGEVIAVVELDDRTHDAARDRRRDAMMAAAGYRTVRFQSRAKPDARTIRAQVLGPR